jgi:hypothetical protein
MDTINDIPLQDIRRFLEDGYAIPSQQWLIADLARHLAALEPLGITTTGDMLNAKKTGLESLSAQSGVPLDFLNGLFGLCRFNSFKPIKLNTLPGIAPEHAARLESAGIKTTAHLLTAARTRQDQQALAERAGISLDCVEKLARMADLTRIPGMKAIRVALYVNGGYDSLRKIATSDPETMRAELSTLIEHTGGTKAPVLPKEALFTVAFARILPEIIEYS